MKPDHIERVVEGDELSADRDAQILDALGRETTASGMTADALGWHHFPFVPEGLRWYELTEALTYPTDTTLPPYAENAKLLFHNPHDDAYSSFAMKDPNVYFPMAPHRGSPVYYRGRPKYFAGHQFPAVYNFQSDRWEALMDRARWYAVAQADWAEGGSYPSGNPYVMCKVCNQWGGDVEREAFAISLPRARKGANTAADPAVYAGDLIQWTVNCEGHEICVSEYLNKKRIKDIDIQGADNMIPTGWHECDGSVQTGNAGAFTLADFVRDYAPVGGEPDHVVGAFPRHRSTDEAIRSAGRWSYLIDGLGHGVEEGVDVVHVPLEGIAKTSPEAPDAHEHWFDVGIGEYPAEIVMFIQRYK